jgi:hypothetical protein
MTSNTILSVENVGKRYTLHHKGKGERYITLRDVIARRAAAPFKAIGEKIRSAERFEWFTFQRFQLCWVQNNGY